MKERPILFNGEMVRAILDGRKTQTRRIMKVQPPSKRHELLTVIESTDRRREGKSHWAILNDERTSVIERHKQFFSCPYGQPGDRLWVRETWADAAFDDGLCICYRADHDRLDVTSNFAATFGRLKYANWAPDLESGVEGQWKPSIHMPRWASRITLEITQVRAERLQDISQSDAKAEGGPTHGHSGAEISPRRGFIHLWSQINGPDNWDKNPWVWVIYFKRIDQEPTA